MKPRAGGDQRGLRGTNDPATSEINPKSNGANGTTQARALEKAAAELGTTPFWLKRRLAQYGLDALDDRDELLRIFRERRDEIRRAARDLRDRVAAEQRLKLPTSSRFGAAARLEVARRTDPDLHRWRQGEPTQNPRSAQRARSWALMRAWRADDGGAA